MSISQRLQGFELTTQFILFLALVTTLWLPSPERDNWVILLLPAALIALAYSAINQRLYGESRFYPVAAAFFFLCILSIYTSPFPNRGWVLLYRPLAGLWILAMWTEMFRSVKSDRWILWVNGALVLFMLIIGLGGLQWTGKAARFSAITDYFPQWQSFWWWSGGLNVNEYAGAVMWILPALTGIAVRQVGDLRLRAIAGITSLFFAFIVVLTQSLSGIIGAAAGILFVFVPTRYFRSTLIVAGAVLLIGNLAILAFPVQSANALASFSGRPDPNSLEHRAVMWHRAQLMFADYPFTGVGIAMYRQLREQYATPGYERFLVPHPHNEALQFATDLGIPGLIIYAWFALTAAQCTWNVYLHGTSPERLIAIALLAGLFGHAVYALTDAIPIWDRFAFVWWWLLGLLSGLDVRISGRQSVPATNMQPSA